MPYFLLSLLITKFLYSKVEQTDGLAVGIDLGTTYSVVTWLNPETGEVEVLKDSQGHDITPSVILWDPESNSYEVGHKAKLDISPSKFKMYDGKRLIGKTWETITKLYPDAIWPVPVVQHEGLARFAPVLSGKLAQKFKKRKTFSPTHLASILLRHLKKYAEERLGQPVTQAVITVPAAFKSPEREATKIAGEMAGLKVLRIINEPTAAALAFGYGQSETSDKERHVLVYDLGGGTFDVSLMSTEGKVIETVASTGNLHLGGQDFDQMLVERFLKANKLAYGDLQPHEKSLVKNEAEKVKILLSNWKKATMQVEIAGKIHKLDFTRLDFENMVRKRLEQTVRQTKDTIAKGKLKNEDVERIVLVGGSSRIPLLKTLLKKTFSIPAEISDSPDFDVAKGAAVQAAILAGVKSAATDDLLLIDSVSYAIGIETAGGAMAAIIQRGDRIPMKKSQTFVPAQQGQTAVDIHIKQGPFKTARRNKELGHFRLDGLGANQPEIEITIDIDSNHIITCTAKEISTGRTKEHTLQNMWQMSESEKKDIEESHAAVAEEDEREAQIIQIKETVRSQTQRIVGQAPEELKSKLNKISEELQAINTWGEEDLKKAKELENEFTTAVGAFGGQQGQGQAQGKSEEEEEFEDEEL